MNRKLLQTFKRVARDDSALEHSEKVQEKVLLEILKRNRNTLFAKEYSLDEIDSADAYMKRMPIAKYGDLKPYIAQMKAGIPHVLLAEDFPRWAETSGTLSSPKFYPFIAEIAEHFGQTLAKIILACKSIL